MSRRNENPLGIRKVDVQEARREAHREARARARFYVNFWFYPGFGTFGQERLPQPDEETVTITRKRLIQFSEVLLERGWESGKNAGVAATKERLVEALYRGTLAKPD